MKRALLDILLESRAAKEPAALITRLSDGSQTLVAGSAVLGAMVATCGGLWLNFRRLGWL